MRKFLFFLLFTTPNCYLLMYYESILMLTRVAMLKFKKKKKEKRKSVLIKLDKAISTMFVKYLSI